MDTLLVLLTALLLNGTLLSAIVAGFELFTVGKNKSTKMSTNAPGSVTSMMGNDGDLVGPPILNVLHTVLGDPLPWWLVDMQDPYAIFGVRLWNRLDGPCPQRFTQISFGIANNSSVWTTFNKDLFDQCFYYTSVPTAADNPINITCQRPIVGRYLAVYMNITGLGDQALLHFVEIDILAMTKGTSFYVAEMQPSFSASSGSLLTEWSSGQKRSQSECLIQCSLLPHCLFALVRPISRDCWLFGSSRITDEFSGSFGSGDAKFLAVYG